MAFDGILTAGLARELNDKLNGGRISKITQPEPDEIMLTVKAHDGQYRLVLSANASLPLVYLTETNKQSPLTAPNFCMLLRKYIGGGRITDISQPSLERILRITVEHLDEMGDLCRKVLIAEIMGKHSNIIFCSEDGVIVDSIKHITAQTSSVREVLPGRTYFVPDTMHKADPLTVSAEEFCARIREKTVPLGKALYTGFTGISPVAAEEICFLAGMDSSLPPFQYSADALQHLYAQFTGYLAPLKTGNFSPAIYYDGEEPKDFSALPLLHFQNYRREDFSSVSALVETFYAERSRLTRIRQKSADLRHIVQTALERSRKKYNLQLLQLKDTENRDKFRVYGELIQTFGYDLEPGAKKLEAQNYYTDTPVTIPLDPTLSAQENAQRYFEKYNKKKRTFEALSRLSAETHEEITYLESVQTYLEMAQTEDDLAQIKDELVHAGYIRFRPAKKKVKKTNAPLHYISGDGFHMYVGKNNLQNEELTFRTAAGNDWWFHAKKAPGSHVIVKAENKELPDATFEEAARLAVHYSSLRNSDKAEVDYVQKKQVKKPNGSRPGFVVYYTNYSMTIDGDISHIRQLS